MLPLPVPHRAYCFSPSRIVHPASFRLTSCILPLPVSHPLPVSDHEEKWGLVLCRAGGAVESS